MIGELRLVDRRQRARSRTSRRRAGARAGSSPSRSPTRIPMMTRTSRSSIRVKPRESRTISLPSRAFATGRYPGGAPARQASVPADGPDDRLSSENCALPTIGSASRRPRGNLGLGRRRARRIEVDDPGSCGEAPGARQVDRDRHRRSGSSRAASPTPLQSAWAGTARPRARHDDVAALLRRVAGKIRGNESPDCRRARLRQHAKLRRICRRMRPRRHTPPARC